MAKGTNQRRAEVSKPIGQGWPVELSSDVTLNMVRHYEDDIDYWIDIQGYRVPLTEKQFIALYEARIQVWDKATEYAEKRIIKLLELEIARHFELGLEASAHYLEGLVELIKGEQK